MKADRPTGVRDFTQMMSKARALVTLNLKAWTWRERGPDPYQPLSVDR